MRRASLKRLVVIGWCALWATVSAPASAQLEPQATQFDQEEAKPKKRPKLTKPPQFIEGEEAVYPPQARAESREGDVVMRIDIDADGLVSRVAIVKSSGFADLDVAAMGAVTTFVFVPAEFDHKPAPVAIEYRQVFQLDVVVEEVATDEAIKAEEERNAQAALDEMVAAETGGAGPAKGPLNFEGIVREAGSKEALEGVEVTVVIEGAIPEGTDINDPNFEYPIEERTTFSDAEGRFFFYGVPEGTHRVSFGLAEFEPSFVEESFSFKERTEVIVYLDPLVSNRLETVVREKKARKEVAKVQLTREEVRKVPGTFGDPLRVIENLPGLARAPFAGGALIVRGANPADTGIYFDGVPIPIVYHFGGLKSVVNAEFLETLDFYPGGFGAYYGRATAGIVDVSSRELKMKSFRGFTDVSVIDTSFFFGGPVEIEGFPKVTVAAAARRSYIDALIPLALDIFVPEAGGIIAAPVYWDYQLKASIEPWTGQTLSLFMFGSDDDLSVVGATGGTEFNFGVKQSFHRIVGRWTSKLPGGLTHFFQPFVGIDGTDLGFGGSFGLEGGLGSGSRNWGVRDELRWRASDALEAAVGIDYLGQTQDFSLEFPIPNEITAFPRVQFRIPDENTAIAAQGQQHAFGTYAEGIFQPTEWFKIVPSVRFDLAYFVIDEEELDAGENLISDRPLLWSVDPRITGRLTVLPGTTLKGAMGVYRQPPTAQDLNSNTGNPYLVMPRAWQFIGGVEQSLTQYLNLDVQMYFTGRDLLLQGTNELINEGNGKIRPVNLTNQGLGRTLGAEFLLRHEIGKYPITFLRDWYKAILGPDLYFGYLDKIFSEVGAFGWIAYTLSRTEIDTSENRDSFILTQFDQTHILTLVGQLNLPLGFTFGGRFRLVSGNPATLPVGSVHDLDTTSYNALPQPARSTRLPTFHQLDFRIDRKFVFDNFSFTPYLDLLNVYNQVNAEQYQIDYRAREREIIQGLPILPNFGLQGEF